jgi:hypothetical protein
MTVVGSPNTPRADASGKMRILDVVDRDDAFVRARRRVNIPLILA